MASARPASQDSGCEQETSDGQSRFVILPAIDDCDDVPSPSQHRLPRASQFSQACLDRMSEDQDLDDGTHSEDGDDEDDEDEVKASNSSGGEEEQDEEEEEEESDGYDEEEQDGYASEAASSRAPSNQPSSHNQLEMLVQNL